MSFEASFEKMMIREGGYVLHKVKHDRGGWTYAGIARNFWPTWEGWEYLDKGEKPPKSLVKAFYKTHFWDKIKGDALHEEVAGTIFDFAVNAGVKTASKLAQNTVGATVDGFIGRQSIALLNKADPEKFKLYYALSKIRRYSEIVRRNPSQVKFLRGWINRTIEAVS